MRATEPFPAPFKGIEYHIYMSSYEEMLEAVAVLTGGCGHHHAIAIFSEDLCVLTSESAKNCWMDWALTPIPKTASIEA